MNLREMLQYVCVYVHVVHVLVINSNVFKVGLLIHCDQLSCSAGSCLCVAVFVVKCILPVVVMNCIV